MKGLPLFTGCAVRGLNITGRTVGVTGCALACVGVLKRASHTLGCVARVHLLQQQER